MEKKEVGVEQLRAAKLRALLAVTKQQQAQGGLIWHDGVLTFYSHLSGGEVRIDLREEEVADLLLYLLQDALQEEDQLRAILVAGTAERDRYRAALEWYATQDAGALAMDAGRLA